MEKATILLPSRPIVLQVKEREPGSFHLASLSGPVLDLLSLCLDHDVLFPRLENAIRISFHYFLANHFHLLYFLPFRCQFRPRSCSNTWATLRKQTTWRILSPLNRRRLSWCSTLRSCRYCRSYPLGRCPLPSWFGFRCWTTNLRLEGKGPKLRQTWP